MAVKEIGEYPSNWKAIAEAIKAEVNYICEWCGVICERLNDNGRQMSVHHLVKHSMKIKMEKD